MKSIRILGSLIVAAGLVVFVSGGKCPTTTSNSGGTNVNPAVAKANCLKVKGAVATKEAKAKTTAFAASCGTDGKVVIGGDPFAVAPGATGNVKVETCTCPTSQCWTGSGCVATAAPAVACSALTAKGKPACDAAVDSQDRFCFWATAGDKNACVPVYDTCAEFNTDATLTGDINKPLRENACGGAGTSAKGYDCEVSSAGTCFGDCRLPQVDCEGATLGDDGCGVADSIERVLCQANSAGDACEDADTTKFVAICTKADTGVPATGEASCIAAKFSGAHSCVWGN